MDKNFFICLQQEQSIFEKFNSNADINNFRAFYATESNEIPHWNLTYPNSITNPYPSKEEILEISKFYSTKKITGNIAVFDKEHSSGFVEESEYFCILESSPKINEAIQEVTHIEMEIEPFSKMIQNAFCLNDATISYFKKKMELLSRSTKTVFYVMKSKNETIGGCSVFTTENGSSFMFNVATMPNFQGNGYAKSIISYAAHLSTKPLYTYSHNPIMRTAILPQLGFKSIGTLWCVPSEIFGAIEK